MTRFASAATRLALTAAIACTALAGIDAASAAPAAPKLPQTPRGKQVTATYTFKAAHRGDITAWLTGSGASYVESIGMLVNGVATGITGLTNNTSVYGDKLVLGHVNRGDTIVFYDNVKTMKKIYYSNTALNPDGVNHVFSAAYAGDAKVPAGTYIAFEDLYGGGDFSYTDETFVFDNVLVRAVPEPASWMLMIAGFGMIGIARRRRAAAVAA